MLCPKQLIITRNHAALQLIRAVTGGSLSNWQGCTYNSELLQRLKTVELIVERTKWTPPPPHYTADTIVYLHIEASDMQMRLKIKEAGGRWNPEKRLWLVNYGRIAGTALEKHIYVDGCL